jgi:RNA polymerase sigma factor (sigma-70 family)
MRSIDRQWTAPAATSSPAPPSSLADLDDVAALYRAEAASVRNFVHAHVVASPAMVEDACQVAWCRLVIHRARLQPETARAWLVRVAVNEVLRAMRRERREWSLEAIAEGDGRSEIDGHMSAIERPPDPADDVVERRVRLEAIRALPMRQRRLLWLQGLGLSYREMAGETGMTRRTVERQLLRARVSLAKVGG